MESIEARLLATEDTDLGLAVEDITGKGRGVVARKPFQKGDFVVEYAGELIDLVAAKEKESEYSQDITKGRGLIQISCCMSTLKHFIFRET